MASKNVADLENEYEVQRLEAVYNRAAPTPVPTASGEPPLPHQPTGQATVPTALRVARDPRLAKVGIGPSTDYLTPEQSANESQRLKVGLQGGATMGGAALASALTPAELPYLAGLGLRAAGAAGGNAIGKIGTGEKPSAREAGYAALGQGVGELLPATAAKVVGLATRVPEETVSATLARPMMKQVETMAKPPAKAEMYIGRKVLGQLGPEGTVSEGRLAMQDTMRQATQKGVTVPPSVVIDAIESSKIPKPQTPGQIRANANLDSFKADVMQNYGETMAPSDVLMRQPAKGSVSVGSKTTEPRNLTPEDTDRILRDARSYVKNAYSNPDPNETTQVFKSVAAKVRAGFHAQMEKSGMGISGSAAKAHEYLDAVDTLDQFISNKTPETFVKSLQKGEDQAQSARDALEQFEKVSGTKGRIMREIDDLGMKREWSTPDKQRALWLFTLLEKVVARPLTKGLVLSTRPAGLIGGMEGGRIGKREPPTPVEQLNP